MAELPLPEKGQQISEHSDPPKASPGLPEPPPPAAPENAARYMDVLSPSERAGAIRSTHNHKGSGCRDCGAIVYDKAVHDKFHETLRRLAHV